MKPHTIIASCALGMVSTALAGVVVNGDCEQNITVAWQIKNVAPSNAASPPASFAATWINNDARPGSAGSKSFFVSGRDNVQDGMRQSISSALIANGNGRTYTTRVWVKIAPTDAEASVRCLLRCADAGVAQIPVLLAEAVVENSGVWVEVTGTAKVQWTTSLTTANLEFEIEQIHKGNPVPYAATWFPSLTMDDLTMELDGDGDGLFDLEESFDHAQTVLPFADVADSDGDRMSDDWEVRFQLSARAAADASVDSDGDMFTNVQEYFGATNPRDAQEFPGKPSDSLATPATRQFLKYLALRPHAQESLVGQMVTDNAVEYQTQVVALAAQPGGKWVSLVGLAVEGKSAPLDIHASIDHAIEFTNAGGIAQVKWAMWNPWRAHLWVSGQQTGGTGDLNKIDIPGLLDPAGTPTIVENTAQENLDARAVLNGWIDTLAIEVQRFNVATNTQPMLFRPLSEMNGDWFWWGHRTRAEYLGLWNYIRSRLIGMHALHNLVWTYESDSGMHAHAGAFAVATASDYYYPGDDAVDVFSHNLYDGDWALRFNANKLYARHPKIYAVPQAGPDKIWPNRAGMWDNRIYANQISSLYPRNSFFIVWNSFNGHLDDDSNPDTPVNNDDPNPGALDNPLQHIGIIDNLFAAELLAHTRIITRDELAWRGIVGDLNGDGSVSGLDLAILLGGWNSASADINGDGTTDGSDLATMMSNWGG